MAPFGNSYQQSTRSPTQARQTPHVCLLLHTTRLLIVQKLTVPPRRAFTDVQKETSKHSFKTCFLCNLGTNYWSSRRCVCIYTHTHGRTHTSTQT